MSVRLWGSEKAVNITTGGEQGSPSVTTLNNGNMVVVWEDLSVDGGQIRARIYAADGTAVGEELTIAALPAAEVDPVVVAVGDGGFHVIYEEGAALKTLTFNADGSADGSQANYGNSGDVAAVGRGGGEGMVQTYLYNGDVWATTYDQAGAVMKDVRVNTTGTGIVSVQTSADIAVTRNSQGALSDTVVVWADSTGIYGRRVDGSGSAVGATDFKISAQSSDVGAPKIAATANGYVVTWVQQGAGGQTDIYGRIYDASGSPMGGAFQVDGALPGSQLQGDVVGLSQGGFIAVWVSGDQIKGQQFSAFGERLGGEFRVGTTNGSVDDSRGVSATFLDDGRVAVSWESGHGDGENNEGVRLQVLDPRDGAVFGTELSETLYGSDFEDQIIAGNGMDKIYAGGGADQVFAGDGGLDYLYGGAGDDALYGEAGYDVLFGGAGADRLDGGAGDDVVDYSDQTSPIVVTLNGSTDAIVKVGGVAQDTVVNVENLIGGSGGDTLSGDGAGNNITGGAGNDLIKGGGGVDYLVGGEGVDTLDYRDKTLGVTLTLSTDAESMVLVADAAEDQVYGFERVYGGSAGDVLTGDQNANRLSGFGGNDVLMGAGGKDTLLGGLGTDTADYSDKTEAVSVTLKGGLSALVKVGGVVEDTIAGMENVHGGSAADTLTGDGLGNLFRGGGGADLIDGKGGSDTIDFSDHSGAVVLTLTGATQATATVDGVAADKVKNIESINGGSGDDTLTGDGFKNLLQGGMGSDTLKGRGGADTLIGGDGADVFVFSFLTDSTTATTGRDTIIDFSGHLNEGQGDTINLSGIDAVSGGANNAFTIGLIEAGSAGRLQITGTDEGVWLVEGDVTGDGAADFAILVHSASTLIDSDFVL